MKYLITCVSILFLLAGCSDTNSDNKAVAGLSSLNGNNFIMEVDRIAESPDVQFPMDELDEANYIAYSGEKIYTVSFSEDGQIITLEPGSLRGDKINAGVITVGYELTKGVFAGGRFVVWINDDKFEAELTIYGSGIPIILSERGNLSPQ
jgi:hypothetical protein